MTQRDLVGSKPRGSSQTLLSPTFKCLSGFKPSFLATPRIFVIFLALVVAASPVNTALAGQADEDRNALDSSPAEVQVQGVGALTLVHAKLQILAVDLENRILTLKKPDGEELSLEVSERVKNLNKVKVGDELAVDYYASVTSKLEKAEGAPRLVESKDVSTSSGSETPSVKVVKTITAIVEVVAIDPPMITIRGPKGALVHTRAENPELLQGIHPKDLVKLTYVEGIAVSLLPAETVPTN